MLSTICVVYQGQEEEHKYDKHDYKFCGTYKAAKTWSFSLFYSQEKTLHQPSIVPDRDLFFSSKVRYLLHSQAKYS